MRSVMVFTVLQMSMITRQDSARGSTSSNRSHRPPPYFEWFYFHFVTPDVAINVVVHETDIFGDEQRPYISMCVLAAGSRAQYYRSAISDGAVNREGPHLRIGEGTIYEDESVCRFDFRFYGKARFCGELIKLALPISFNGGLLHEDSATKRTSQWAVTVPHAAFTGILEVDGSSQRLQGVAYQDHQWGSLPFQEFVYDWIWGQFSNDEVALIFLQVMTQQGSWIERLALITRGGQYVSTELETDFLDSLSVHGRPHELVQDLSLSFLREACQLEFNLDPKRLMRIRENEGHGRFQVSYLRWASSGTLQVGCDRYSLHGISEYMRIRPRMYGSLP